MTTSANKVEEDDVSYLNMSDEDLNNVDPRVFDEPVASNEEPQDTATEETEAVVDPVDPNVEAQENTDEEDDITAVDASEEEATKTTTAETVEPSEAKQAKPAVAEDGKPKIEAAETDYKAVYDKLFTPFKANGKDIAINSVDDAISLMQMGANYNKKMAALKPSMKLLKLLENNGLLDEKKIGFLIDLEKKNPNAINKLVQDSGINPMDLDAEQASGYKPNTYTVDDKEIELDAILDEIQETPTYSKTLDVVGNKWDGPSKQAVATSPQLLKVINTHMENGIYDLISKAVESERMFGRLNGLSDIDAYKTVGDAIQSRGGFNHLGLGNKNQPQATTAPKNPVVAPAKPKLSEDQLRDKRRAASSTKPASSNVIPQDYNPLAMSDEEFNKQVNSRYL